MPSLSCAQTFRACMLVKELVPNPPPPPDIMGVPFGTLFSPHMLNIEFDKHGWGSPRIEPLQPLSLPPYAACVHYGIQCFEGLKVYSDIEDIKKVERGESLCGQRKLRMFRPQFNVARLKASMARLCLPSFDESEFLKLLEEYVKIEKDYIPTKMGYAMYLRPSAIGIGNGIGAVPSESGRLFVFASPVGRYFSNKAGEASETNLGSVRLLVDEFNRRAWPGGIGSFKLGANYAAPMLVQREAAKEGFKQVLWLGPNREITEVGAMNFMTLWRTPEGVVELITASLDGMILPGVTRDSILSLVRQWGEITVSEHCFTIDELIRAIEEERVLECFGCGTAAVLSPVNGLRYRGKDYSIPCPTNEHSLHLRLYKAIVDIQYGKVPNEWSYPINA